MLFFIFSGDSMAYHNTQSFSTKDQKNDRDKNRNCAERYKSGWWYNSCYYVNLNGLYHKGQYENQDGISWRTFTGDNASLAWTEIKIRPKNFRVPFS